MRRTLTATAFVIAIVIVGDSTALRSQGSMEPPPRNLDEFDRMFNELSNGDRWGRDDQLGTINLVAPAKVRQAASLVKSGLSVSLAHNTTPSPSRGSQTRRVESRCHYERNPDRHPAAARCAISRTGHGGVHARHRSMGEEVWCASDLGRRCASLHRPVGKTRSHGAVALARTRRGISCIRWEMAQGA